MNLGQAALLVAWALFSEAQSSGSAGFEGRTLGGSSRRFPQSTARASKKSARDTLADIPQIEPAVVRASSSLLERVGYLRGVQTGQSTPDCSPGPPARQGFSTTCRSPAWNGSENRVGSGESGGRIGRPRDGIDRWIDRAARAHTATIPPAGRPASARGPALPHPVTLPSPKCATRGRFAPVEFPPWRRSSSKAVPLSTEPSVLPAPRTPRSRSSSRRCSPRVSTASQTSRISRTSRPRSRCWAAWAAPA